MSKPAKTLQPVAQLVLGIAAPSTSTRLTREQVRCTGCASVYQRPAYSLAAKHRDQIMECPCGAKVRIPGEHDAG
jgi:hypothetical protein